MPTPRQLEIFLAAAVKASFREAADALGVSQPSVSKQIKALERTVGGDLFLRRCGASARLSALGEELLQDASRTLDLQRRLEKRRSIRPPVAETTIFITHYLLEGIKPRLESLFARGLPRASKFVVVNDSPELISKVKDDTNSFGLLRSFQLIDGAGVQAAIVREEPCSVYANPRLAEAVNRGQFDRNIVPVKLSGQNAYLGAWQRRNLANAGFKDSRFDYSYYFHDLLIVEVAEGESAAIFLESQAEEFVRAGKLMAIEARIDPIYLCLTANNAVDASLFKRMTSLFREAS